MGGLLNLDSSPRLGSSRHGQLPTTEGRSYRDLPKGQVLIWAGPPMVPRRLAGGYVWRAKLFERFFGRFVQGSASLDVRA